jgi:hypothetical protein
LGLAELISCSIQLCKECFEIFEEIFDTWVSRKLSIEFETLVKPIPIMATNDEIFVEILRHWYEVVYSDQEIGKL